MGALRAWLFLVGLSLRRQLAAGRKLWAILGLVAVALGFTLLARRFEPRSPELYVGFVLRGLYGSFILPVILLAFGTAALGDERDEGTLLYLSCRPLWRWSVYAAKFVAALPLGVGFSLAALGLLSAAVGGGVREHLGEIAPVYLGSALAYLAFFHCLGALFQHSTLIAVAYVFFIEVFLAGVPGIVKYLRLSFYSASRLSEVLQRLGLEDPARSPFLQWIQPLDGVTASWALLGIALACLVLGAVVFSRRDFAGGP